MRALLATLILCVFAAIPAEARPAAWCGWYMRQLLHERDSQYDLARNWAHWGSAAAGPAVGIVVVWPHHVGLIVGHAGGGRWIVKSGNDGHAARARPLSLAGAIAFRAGAATRIYLPQHGDLGFF